MRTSIKNQHMKTSVLKNMTYKFELLPLPYPKEALEPYIDALTMEMDTITALPLVLKREP